MASSEHKKGSRTLHLADAMRKAIISGELAPGSALRQEDLARRFASSRMPVREALRTLDAEGLVRLHPNRGAIVAPIDADELRENVEMREAAELLAMRLAMPHLSNAQIDKAAAIHAEAVEAEASALGALNKAFHMTLYAPCGRPRLLAHISGLHDIAERYLRFTLTELDYVGRSAAEHEALLDACYRRDDKAAQALLSRHITEAGKALEQYLREKPEPRETS